MTTIVALITALMITISPTTDMDNNNPSADPLDQTEWAENDLIV